MKKFLTLLLVITLLTGTTYTFADSDILHLSLEDAQARALENNLDYRLQDSEIKDAQEAYYDAADASTKSSGGFMSYFNSTITYDVNLNSASNSLQLSRFEKDNIKRTSDNNVKTAFINIKKAQYSLDDAKNTVTLKSKDYEVAKVKHQLGYLTSDDLKTAEKAYNDAVANIDTSLKKLHEEIQSLNKLIARPITDYNIEPVISLGIPDIATIDLNKIREDYIKSNKDLYAAAQSVELAKRKYELTEERYEHFVKDMNMKLARDDMEEAYDAATRSYDKAKSSFEDATRDLDITLNSSYNTLKNTKESIDRLLRDIQDTKSDVQKAKIKYDLGLMSRNDYEKLEISLKTMQNSLDTAIANYNLQYAGLTLYSNNNTVAKQ